MKLEGFRGRQPDLDGGSPLTSAITIEHGEFVVINDEPEFAGDYNCS